MYSVQRVFKVLCKEDYMVDLFSILLKLKVGWNF